MSKTIEDYRNIVKILKLQLLKIREENGHLSKEMGIVSQSETSSFSPKINHYKQSSKSFAKKIILFLQFAHRCQLAGITPQMIFRIADKKRDQKVSASSLSQVMKRLKLRMGQDQIQSLVSILANRGNSIYYQQYLQYISAFQINSQKFPAQSSRTYVQLCLISFAKQCKKKFASVKDIYKNIDQTNKGYVQFDPFVSFCSKECKQLKQVEIFAVFLGLDIQSQCKIQENVFKRQIQKIYSLIDKGHADDKISRSFINKGGNSKIRNPAKQQEQQEFAQETSVGDQAFSKKQKQTKPVLKQQNSSRKSVKLDKGTVKKFQGELKKQNVSIGQFIKNLLDKQRKDIIPRSFSLRDIQVALKSINSNFPKKKIIEVVKLLDKDGNGSTSTQQLIKLWMRRQQSKSNSDIKYLEKLLNRHLKQTQYPEPILRFTNLGYKPEQILTQNHLRQVFESLNLTSQQIEYISNSLGSRVTIQKFCTSLKAQGKDNIKKFAKMTKDDQKRLASIISGLLNKTKENTNFKKLIRLEDLKPQGQDQASWKTIFTDQIACYQYCLNTASKLQSFWRDPQFGPTKSDPHGILSIVGNESQPPPGLPEQNDIEWLSYEQIIKRKNEQVAQVNFMTKDLRSTDVVQGKLGDCWFVSALSIIANNDEYIRGKSIKQCQNNPQMLTYGIHPVLFHPFVNYGMYVFKFFKKFKPVYVVVDQLFPVQSSTNDLLFAKSPALNLQWVSFAQKAYSKLHHTYSNMISGDIAQGLNDLTNALPIKQNLKAGSSQNILKIQKLKRQKQLMGCSITAPKGTGVQQPVELNDQRCGLFYGHAYSIIDFLQFNTKDKNKFELMRLRNPWGQKEWLLDWSDTPQDGNPQYMSLQKYKQDLDQYYEKKIKQAQRNRQQPPIKYKPGNDGQFLMKFQDFSQIFTNLFTGIQFKQSVKYQGKYIIDKWDASAPSGLCKMKGAKPQQQKEFITNNHQYVLQVKQSQSDVLMLAIQQDGRLYKGQKYPYKQLVNAVIILVFRLDSGQRSLKQFDKNKMVDPNNLKLQVRRDVDFWYKLQKGRYAIIPCKIKNDIPQTQFEFRIYCDKPISIQKIQKGSSKFQQLRQEPLKIAKINQKDRKALLDYLKQKNISYVSETQGDKTK